MMGVSHTMQLQLWVSMDRVCVLLLVLSIARFQSGVALSVFVVVVVVVDFSARLRSWVHSVGVRIHNILDQSHPTNTNITRTMGSMFDVALIIIRLLCVISSHLFYYNANK